MPIKKSETKKIQEDAEVDTSEILDDEVEEVDEVVEVEDLDETDASDTLKPNSKPVGPANKAFDMSKIIHALAGMDKETINKFAASMDWVKDAADGVKSGAAEKNKHTIDAKPSNAVKEDEEINIDDDVKAVITEEIASLFEGENIKPEFKEKLSVVIESTVNLKSSQRIAELEEEYETALINEVTEIKDAIVDNLDKLLNAVVDQWLDENEVELVSSIRTDLAEQFVDDLRDLFDTHYITVPEDKVDVVEEMNNRIEELEDILNTQLAEKLELEKEISDRDDKIEESQVFAKITELAEGLTASDKERFLSLVENTEYEDLEDFSKKAKILKESIYNTDDKSGKTKVLFEETEVLDDVDNNKTKEVNGPMAHYIKALERTNTNF